LRLDGDVEVRGGLVGDDKPRPASQRDRADDALAHAHRSSGAGYSRSRHSGDGDADGAEQVLHALA
jgi:hypothetical protein